MKKVFLALMAVLACGMILTSCNTHKATGLIEYGISDGTATGLSHDNFLGLYEEYIDAVNDGFQKAGCSVGQYTHSGGLLMTGEMMSQKQLDKYVKSHTDEIIDNKIKELREKYPDNIKTDVFRFVYSVGDGEKKVYDKTIEV